MMFSSKILTVFAIGIVGFFGLAISASATDSVIPEWIKNNAKWWSEGSINDTDYIESLEYLINNGIIDVPIPITEVTAAQTMYSNEERAQSFRVTISNIVAPIPVHFFEKFSFTNVDSADPNDPRGKVYDFRDINPTFYLESLPSVDKISFYNFVADWMDKGNVLKNLI